MPQMLANTPVTSPDKAPVTARHSMAKATLRDKTAGDRLSPVVMDVTKRVFEKQGAAASHLGKDEGNFSRDGKAGRLTTAQLSALGPTFLAELGAELVEQFGPMAKSPVEHAEQKLDEIQAAINEVRQYVRQIA